MTQKLYRSTTVPVEHAQVWVLVNDLGNRLQVHRIGDAPSETCILPREWLEPIVPPSIDDPIDRPWVNRDGEWTVQIRESAKREHAGVLDLSMAVRGSLAVGMTADELRKLARICWQRADAWERGRSAAGGA